jgi:phage gp36-like protein
MYCSLTDLQLALNPVTLLQLCDDAGAGSFVASPTPNGAYNNLVAAINAADTLIDGYLSGRYTVPFTTVPSLVKQLSIDLTVCNLYGRHRESDPPDGISQKRKDAVKTLEAIKGETINLPGESIREPGVVKTNKTAEDRLFSDELLGMM